MCWLKHVIVITKMDTFIPTTAVDTVLGLHIRPAYIITTLCKFKYRQQKHIRPVSIITFRVYILDLHLRLQCPTFYKFNNTHQKHLRHMSMIMIRVYILDLHLLRSISLIIHSRNICRWLLRSVRGQELCRFVSVVFFQIGKLNNMMYFLW